jgi:hypothetical protein
MIIKSVGVTILEDMTQMSNYMTALVSKKWSHLLRLLQDHVRISNGKSSIFEER